MNKFKSFSLVELMVVIAIIGILSAIAVPNYKSYVIKTKIASGISIMENAINLAIDGYETNGSLPNPISLYGNSIPIGTFSAINSPPLRGIYYHSTAANNVYVCIYFIDIGIAGYVPDGGGNMGTYNRICMSATANNNIWQKFCGIWGVGQTMDIPIQYLSSGCNCDYLYGAAYSLISGCMH